MNDSADQVESSKEGPADGSRVDSIVCGWLRN